MKTISIEAYQIEELSEKVRDRLYQKWLSHGGSEYFWWDEAIASIKEFCRFFDCELRDYSVDSVRSTFKFDSEHDSAVGSEMRDIVLYNYQAMKLYAKYGKSDSCELTGYCTDEELLIPVREYLVGKREYATYRDLMHDCLTDAFRDISKDMEYHESMECFIESRQGDYFTINGAEL